MDAAVHLPLLYDIAKATPNCTLNSRHVVTLEKTPVLHTSQDNEQFYHIVAMHNLQFRNAVIVSYDVQFLQFICC